MIPQTQRFWRGPVFDPADPVEQTDEGGDCFSACLASLLEVPIEGFPNFLDSRPLGNGGWYQKWQLWLYEHYRAELLWWATRDEIPDPATQQAWWIAGVMVGATSHSVLFHKDEFRWDPAPDGRKRVWTLDDVVDGVALFSIASIFGRTDGPYEALFDADGNPIVAEALDAAS